MPWVEVEEVGNELGRCKGETGESCGSDREQKILRVTADEVESSQNAT
jgi:hypothetical protein